MGEMVALYPLVRWAGELERALAMKGGCVGFDGREWVQ